MNNYRFPVKENHHLAERLSLDEEFDLSSEDQQEDINNSFIYMLCERLSGQFSFRHIHYEDFEQLKTKMIETMSTSNGYIIDHFPTSLDDLRKFQKEVIILIFVLWPYWFFLVITDWTLCSIDLYW